jgi:hypothetical protein
LAETRHRRANWFRIDVPHYLSDVLFLTAKRTVRLDFACFEDGFEQILIQPDLSEI